MDHLQYLIVLGGCLVVTLPLELVLGARVYRQPRRLAVAVLPAAVIFYVWDAVAISRGHWTFAPRYVSGITLPFGVPLEELAFFVVIPICALLSFEAVSTLLDPERRAALPVLAWLRHGERDRSDTSSSLAGGR
jgi:lycopene cyclase domain-containing protein